MCRIVTTRTAVSIISKECAKSIVYTDPSEVERRDRSGSPAFLMKDSDGVLLTLTDGHF
jgi:hypothetical protein